ncbi:MAG: hypothetical protein ACO3UU_16310 [Minisyncoccia bacterium]
MAISSETYNKDLYSLLKTKGYRPIPLDFKNEKTDPELAVVFEFQFKKDGEKYGVSYVTVDNNVTVGNIQWIKKRLTRVITQWEKQQVIMMLFQL